MTAGRADFEGPLWVVGGPEHLAENSPFASGTTPDLEADVANGPVGW